MPPTARRRTTDERKAAIENLFRVRAVETPMDDHGEKSVWHQGNKGADLLTMVNATGHVARQEFTLFDDYFVWTKESGMRTGRAADGSGSQASKASDDIVFDRDIDHDRVRRAIDALERYEGSDKYLLHIRTLLRMVVSATEERSLSAVTSARPVNDTLRDTAKRTLHPTIWPYLAAGFGVGIAVVGVLWLFLR